MDAVFPCSDHPANWPDEGRLPEVELSGATTHYVLPLQWSLYYVLSKQEWGRLRSWHRKMYRDWNHCACRNRCPTEPFDEKWEYEHATHTKIFIGAEFICRGCHWLKSLPWRINMWLRKEKGLMPALTKPPHIIECLGWTQPQVDDLREMDLRRDKEEKSLMACLDEQVRVGRAALVPAPPERLSLRERQRLVKPGQVMVVPWRINLHGLSHYGYSRRQILEFERRMYELAAKRLTGVDDGSWHWS